MRLDLSAAEEHSERLPQTQVQTGARATGWEHRVLRVVVVVETAIVGLIAAGIFVVVLGQTVSRYFFDRPLTWGGEVAQLGFIWLTFTGAVLVMAKDRHVTVHVLGRALGARGRMVLAVGSEGLVTLACVVFVVAGYNTAIDRMQLAMPATGWPAGLPLIASLVGFALMGFHAMLNMWLALRYGYVDRETEV